MSAGSVDEAFLGLLERVSRLIGSLGGGEPQLLARHDLDVWALFDRCRSLLGAVRLLIGSGFPHEAMILGRPLLTDSLALAELAAVDDHRRAELVLGWELRSIADLQGILCEFQSQGRDVTDNAAAVDARRAQAEEYGRERGLSLRFWRPDANTAALAKKHGREGELLDLRVLHNFVHGSTIATAQRYSQVAPDSVEVGGPAVDRDTWARASGLSAAYSALFAARAFCSIAKLAEPPELATLLAEVEAQQRTSDQEDDSGRLP